MLPLLTIALLLTQDTPLYSYLFLKHDYLHHIVS